jgi:hypothetical protein
LSGLFSRIGIESRTTAPSNRRCETAINTQEPPAAPFDQARKFAAGDWSYGNFQDPFFTVVFWLGYLHRQAPFDRLSDIAEEFFHRFAFRSAAGIAGTSAQKPPSSASCTTILIFMFVSVRAK